MERIALARLTAVFVGSLGVASGAWSASAQAETLDWLTYKPAGAGDPQQVTTQWFADELKKRTQGEYDINIHWGGSVAGIREIPDALEGGLGDIGDVVTPYFPDQLLVNNAISFFFPQPHSSVELGKLMIEWNDWYPQFDEELAKYNLKVVGFRPLENYGMMCREPVRSAEDLEGKRIRSYGFALPRLIEALGATPVSMSTPEAYEALQRGILDCTPIGITLAHGWKYDEVAKYYIDIPLGASWGHLITMNLDSYNELDPVTQDIIEGLGREYLLEYVKQIDAYTAEVKELWKNEMGVEIIPFPREDLVEAAQSEGVQSIRREWIERAKQTGLPAEQIAAQLEFQ